MKPRHPWAKDKPPEWLSCYFFGMQQKFKIELLKVSRQSGFPAIELITAGQMHRVSIPERIIEVAERTGEPVPIPASTASDAWLYRGYVVRVHNANCDDDELFLRIKHAVLSREREFDKLKRQVEAFENFEALAKTPRDRIPEPVKMFVWQRDAGRCVSCGSRERLEYDHVIPLAKGGSNTERNIQLLCEGCNRTKGDAISRER